VQDLYPIGDGTVAESGPPYPQAPARIQGLWKTGMTKNDYIEFLSENLWIWGSHWGNAIEWACKTENLAVDMRITEI
jgi:hypothetical protein